MIDTGYNYVKFTYPKIRTKKREYIQCTSPTVRGGRIT